MKIVEAIILAGGLGTRLHSVVPDLPKCMATVNGKPFIFYDIKYLHKQGIEKFIFALGYKHEVIIEYIEALQVNYKTSDSLRTSQNPSFAVEYSIEKEPLGTGGAIKLASTVSKEKNVLVVNGDTLFKVDVTRLSDFHISNNAHCTLSLKPLKKFERYGIVELNNDQSIKHFKEKRYFDEGLINGGMYLLNANKFSEEELPTKFSFEKDYLEKFYRHRKMYGVVQDRYFIDIGVPEDYRRAQRELITEFDD
jgi:D-glycero-alpha-D-manno-heptose 1-phosphate guanylyltransferase